MFCGKKKNKRKALEPVDLNIKILSQRYRFSPKEFEEYRKEFGCLSDGRATFTLQRFCEKMGPLGLEPTRLISDRIFAVMNKNKSGQVNMQEYLEYMDILMHGTSYEKMLQSFKLISQDLTKSISYSQFESWIIKVWKMLNILTGAEITATQENIMTLFRKMDLKADGVIDLEEFEFAMKDKNGLGEWFDIVNQQISDDLNVAVGKKEILDIIEDEIKECINMLNERDCRSDISEKENPDEAESDILIDSHFSIPKGDLDSFATFQDVGIDSVVQKLEKVLGCLSELREKVPKKHIRKPGNPKNLIKWGDNDWNLVMSMMIGIQKSINSFQFNGGLELSSSEFLYKQKQVLPSRCSKSSFTFTEYAPSVFHRLRNHFNLTPSEYLSSLGVEKIVSSLMANEFSSLSGQCSSGKSGSFFFYSSDGKFLLKTITISEYSLLRKMLPDYFFHMLRNPESLLTKFYGLHKIVGEGTIYFVIMGNTFNTQLEINKKFDLKGSTYGRTTNPTADCSVARKDLDFKDKVRVGNDLKKYILSQVEADVELLERMKIIDYSFLLGISDNTGQNAQGGVLSTDRGEVYFFGIIDFLTKFGIKKKIEHFVMGTLHGKNEVSCVPPRKYSKRFISYLSKIME